MEEMGEVIGNENVMVGRNENSINDFSEQGMMSVLGSASEAGPISAVSMKACLSAGDVVIGRKNAYKKLIH